MDLDYIKWKFWLKVKRSHLWECWPWIGARDKDGYGQFNYDGHTVRAHRVAFFLTKGKWPKNLALHECDYPPCCNPFHIFDGTRKDNTQQSHARGRAHNQYR